MPFTEQDIDAMTIDDIMRAWCQLSVKLEVILASSHKMHGHLEDHANNCDLVIDQFANDLYEQYKGGE